MEQFGITLYYTDNHPANGQPFFTEKKLIEEAHDICNNQDDNEIIVTTAEAITYLQDQGYGLFHETTQYFDDCDITYVDIERRGKLTTIVPHINLKNIQQSYHIST